MKQFRTKNEFTGTNVYQQFDRVKTVSKFPWYARLLLPFKKMRYGHDFGSGEESGVVIGYKELFGVTYVLVELQLPEDIASLMRDV